MKLSQRQRTILGALTIWPLFYFPLFMLAVATFVFLGSNNLIVDEKTLFFVFLLIFPIHLLTSLNILVLVIFYVIQVAQNSELNSEERRKWIVGLLLLNIFVMPIYWKRYFRFEET